MKKIIGLCLIAMVLTLTANAQNSNLRYSVGGGFVSGNFGGESLNGYGIDFIVKKDLSETLEGFGQIGYNTFSKSYVPDGYTASQLSLNAKINIIPILVGVNYKAGNFKPGIGIGYSTANGSFDISGSLAGGTNLDVTHATTGGLTLSPQLGYNFNKVDVVAQYLSISASGGNANGFGLKVYYNF